MKYIEKVNSNERLHSIDYLKGLLIIFVIITHNNFTENQRLLFFFPFWIKMAVPGFMIISGFTLCLAQKKKNMKFLDNYKPKILIQKLLRFLIPYTLIYVIEYIYIYIRK